MTQKGVICLVILFCSLSFANLSQASDFGITPQQLKKQFNSYVKQLSGGEQYRINEIEIKEGPAKNTFNLHYPGISMVGGVKKDSGKIDGIMLIGKGDQSTIVSALAIYAGLMQVFQTSLSKKEKGAIVKTLLTELPERGKNSKTLGNIKYASNFSTMTGLILSIESVS